MSTPGQVSIGGQVCAVPVQVSAVPGQVSIGGSVCAVPGQVSV